jgi:hypothetical protein
VLAVEVERHALERPAEDVEKLAGARIAGVVVEEVAVGALFHRVTAGDDVEPQPAAGQLLEGGRLLGDQGRQREPGPQRDEELQPLGDRRQRRADDPRVQAARADGRQHPGETRLLGGPGDRRQVVQRRRPAEGAGIGAAGGGRGRDVAAVAAGGQEPVELHDCGANHTKPIGFDGIAVEALSSAATTWGVPAPPTGRRSAMAIRLLTSRRTVDHGRIASALCRAS